MAVTLDNVQLDTNATFTEVLGFARGLVDRDQPIEELFGPSGKAVTIVISRSEMIQLAQACPDGSNRCLSRNHFDRVPGARTKRDFNDVGWGQNPHQGRGTKQAGPNYRQIDSYDAHPRLRFNQRGQFFNGRECIVVAGGDTTAGGTTPRRVVSRRPGTAASCPTVVLD